MFDLTVFIVYVLGITFVSVVGALAVRAIYRRVKAAHELAALAEECAERQRQREEQPFPRSYRGRVVTPAPTPPPPSSTSASGDGGGINPLLAGVIGYELGRSHEEHSAPTEDRQPSFESGGGSFGGGGASDSWDGGGSDSDSDSDGGDSGGGGGGGD